MLVHQASDHSSAIAYCSARVQLDLGSWGHKVTCTRCLALLGLIPACGQCGGRGTVQVRADRWPAADGAVLVLAVCGECDGTGKRAT